MLWANESCNDGTVVDCKYKGYNPAGRLHGGSMERVTGGSK